MRMNLRISLGIALALAMPDVSSAQTGQIGSYNRPKTNSYPTVSPYLNLGRGGNNAAVNYYGLVRPQKDANRAFQQLDPALFGGDPRLGLNGTAIGPDGNPIPGSKQYLPNQALGLQTGHPATYLYYSHYYPIQAGQRGGATSGGTTGAGNFGRPSTQATPFFFGSNGIYLPVNPSGPNPIGGSPFGAQPQVPGQIIR